jgi:signal transduction histidine kinase
MARIAQRQRLELLGALAVGIAHDFNNVLTSIRGNIEVADMVADDTAAVRQQLAVLRQAGELATELVRQILTFGRQEQPERRPIRLQPVVAEAIRMVRSSLPDAVTVDALLDPLAPMVMANGCQIEQVLLNLSVNAAHAMRDQGGRLTVRLDLAELEKPAFEHFPGLKAGAYVRLTVGDTGCGMNPETAKRIFEAFFTTKSPEEGSGLGLAIVHNIVKDHEGAVAVQSSEGIGTVFTLYFPVHRAGD